MSRLRNPVSPAESGVRADQHEGAILTGHLVDEALNVALRQIARRLLALSRKGYGTRGIELNAFVRNCSSRHCRKAKTALRVVAADSPELRRVDTHSRTTALVILLSGTEPK